MKPVLKFEDLDVTKQYSYADYLTWQFSERVELIKGWIYKMDPGPNKAHQIASRIINGEMYNYFKVTSFSLYSAPFDVRLLDAKKSKEDKKVFTVVQPDIFVVCDDSKVENRGCVGAPDLVIEILSAGNAKRDLKIKYALYEENGVKEYWIADPAEQTIMLYQIVKNKFQLHKIFFDDDVIESILFKGLKINVGDIFTGSISK
jgi:Uma2 family endonuclease